MTDFKITKLKTWDGHDTFPAYSLQLQKGSMVLATVTNDGWGGGSVWQSMVDADGSVYHTDNKLRDAIYVAVREHYNATNDDGWEKFEEGSSKWFWIAADCWVESLIDDVEHQKWIQTKTRSQIFFTLTSTPKDEYLGCPRRAVMWRDDDGVPTHWHPENVKLSDPRQPQVERDLVEYLERKYGDNLTGIYGLRHCSWSKADAVGSTK
jgi:hypothetical protein